MTTSRRGFLGGFAAALAGFSILPAATAYTRLWKAVRVPRWRINPAYENAPYEVGFIWHKSGYDTLVVGRESLVAFKGTQTDMGVLIDKNQKIRRLPLPMRFADIPPADTWESKGFWTWAEEHQIQAFVKG